MLRDSYRTPDNVTDDQIDEYARSIGSPNGRYALLKTAKQAIPDNSDEIIRKYRTIDVPTLILHGDGDQIVPIANSEPLSAKLVKGSSRKVIPGAPHGMCSTLKDQITSELLVFFRRAHRGSS